MTSIIQEYLEKQKYNEITELCSHQEQGFAQKKAETLLKYLNPNINNYSGNLWISDHYLNSLTLDAYLDCSKSNGTPYFQITNLGEELSYLDETHHLDLVKKVKKINQHYNQILKEEEEKLAKMTEGEICEYYQELAQKHQKENDNKYDNKDDNRDDNRDDSEQSDLEDND